MFICANLWILTRSTDGTSNVVIGIVIEIDLDLDLDCDCDCDCDLDPRVPKQQFAIRCSLIEVCRDGSSRSSGILARRMLSHGDAQGTGHGGTLKTTPLQAAGFQSRARTVSRLSACAAGLSSRQRRMRGNRTAIPDLWRFDSPMPSKAISKTSSGSTTRTGPCFSRVC